MSLPSWNFIVQEFLCLSCPSPFSYSLYLVTRSSGFPLVNIIANASASFYSYYQHSSQSSDISSQEDETVCYMVCLRPLSAINMLLFYLKLFNNLLLLFRKSLVSFILFIYKSLNDTYTTLFISSHMPSVFDCVISSAAKATTSLSFIHQSLDIFSA